MKRKLRAALHPLRQLALLRLRLLTRRRRRSRAGPWLGRGRKTAAGGRCGARRELAARPGRAALVRDRGGYALLRHLSRRRAFGSIAVVQGYDDETSSEKGKDTSGTYSWTDVFQKQKESLGKGS